MAMTDPIADMLTRIRNGIQAGKKSVLMPSSKMKKSILDRFLEEGYIGSVSVEEEGPQGTISVVLKYDENERSAIAGLRKISKPGRRVYVPADEIPRELSGYGTVILSTSRGVVTDRKARELGVGGEVICSVW